MTTLRVLIINTNSFNIKNVRNINDVLRSNTKLSTILFAYLTIFTLKYYVIYFNNGTHKHPVCGLSELNRPVESIDWSFPLSAPLGLIKNQVIFFSHLKLKVCFTPKL